MFRKQDPELAVGEVDRDLLEGAHCVHSKEQSRLVVELELLERVRIGKDHGKVAEGYIAKAQFANERIFAADCVTGNRLELHGLNVAGSLPAEELPAQRFV